MQHLFNSAVRIEELQLTVSDGRAISDWVVVHEWLKCRLDLNFVRPGKDILPAPVAGRAPDRIGVMFCAADAPLKAGQRVVTIPNEYGQEPVSGTFEIRVIPDLALDYTRAHHMEVQVLETNQDLTDRWPDDVAPEDEE